MESLRWTELLGEDFVEVAVTAEKCGAFLTRKAIYNIAAALGLRVRGGFRDAMLKSLLDEAERAGALAYVLRMLHDYYSAYSAVLRKYADNPHVSVALKKLEEVQARLLQAVQQLEDRQTS